MRRLNGTRVFSVMYKRLAVLVLICIVALPLTPKHGDATPFRFVITCDQRYYSGPGGYDTSNYFRGVCQAIESLGAGAFMVNPGDVDPVEDVHWTIEQYIDSDYL